jgi:hypothetical protein
MIALAKTQTPSATLYHADVCEWMPIKQYDYITAWDSIWHVPLDSSASVLRKLCGALTSGGIIIWTTGGLDGPREKRDSNMGPTVYHGVLDITQTLQTISDVDVSVGISSMINFPRSMFSSSRKKPN